MVDLNHYSATVINRAAERRRDDAWVAERLNDMSTRFIPVWHGHNLVLEQSKAGAVMLGRDAFADLLAHPKAEPILLGVDQAGAIFAVDVSFLE